MKKILLFVLLVFYISISFASFNVLINGLANSYEKKLVGIDFSNGGNSLGGFLFVKQFKDISDHPETIILPDGNKKKNCMFKLEGYYYNTLHGQILYPLDDETLAYWKGLNPNYYKNLSIEGGFYAGCEGDPDSIYGQVVYKKDGKVIYSLYAGFKYDSTNNKFLYDKFQFANNLQKVLTDDGYNVIGLIYDSTLGIGFVGGKINGGQKALKKIVDVLNNSSVEDIVTDVGKVISTMIGVDIQSVYGIQVLTNFLVRGLLGMGEGLNKIYTAKQVLTNFIKSNKSSIVLKGKILNISEVLNRLRKNTQDICEGKWNVRPGTLPLNVIKSTDADIGGTICLKLDNSKIVVEDNLTIGGKVTNIIIKGKNDKLIFKAVQTGPGYLNVFVDGGYVLFDNNASLVGIDENGKYKESGGVTSGYVFDGNLYVNGLIAGYDYNNNKIEDFKHKLYFNGRLVSLNTIGDNTARENYVEDMGLEKKYVNIMKTFSWQCLDNGKGTDGANCSDANDKYAFNSIIIQAKNYNKDLLK